MPTRRNAPSRDPDELSESVVPVDAVRLSTSGAPPRRERCKVVVEQPITLQVESVGDYTVMCTPNDLRPLAVGFLFSEGVIAGPDDIAILSRCDDDPSVIRVKLARSPADPTAGRTLIVSSSCGVCGSRNIDRILSELKPVGSSLRVAGRLLVEVAEKMHSLQGIFAQTGGTHAAAVFTAAGEVLTFAEDIGRHNALDKAIGKCLLTGQSTEGCGAMLSGRVSLELAAKAARAGIELLAAVSAPSSLAVQVAEHCRITLCGFVRGDRATVFCCPERIADLPAAAGSASE